jgi:FSR family fosmidomycin resistance protein-like MFS transporter
VFGVRETAWPSIRHDLGLSYVEIGVLLTVPDLVASVVEPVLALARNRRRLIVAGGVAFAAALAATPVAPGFVPLLVATVLLYPASGAFVSLSQATLIDLEPDAPERAMARWTLAGSVGVVAGPLLLAAALALGAGWRGAFVVLAALGLVLTWAIRSVPVPASGGEPLRTAFRDALRELRRADVLRWLAVLDLGDLMLDVLLGFLALYVVDVAGKSPTEAGLYVAVWTGAGLLGDALLLPLLRRVDGVRYLRTSAAAVAVLFPAFLLAPETAKLPLLAGLGLANAGWYAIPMARLYSAFPGRSGTALAVSNLAGFAGHATPVAVGALAASVGLGPAMWVLLLGPLGLLLLLPSPRRGRPRRRPRSSRDQGPGIPRARRSGRPRADGH